MITVLSAVIPIVCSSPTSILQDMQTSDGFAADYREEKRLQLLAEPLRTTGKIYFSKSPRRLVKTTATTHLIVSDTTMWMTRAGKTQRMDFSSYPAVGITVQAFMAIAGGDTTVLENEFEVHWNAKGDSWTVKLTPKNTQLTRLFALIQIRGVERQVRQLRIEESNGDVSTTVFENILTSPRFDPKIFETPNP